MISYTARLKDRSNWGLSLKGSGLITKDCCTKWPGPKSNYKGRNLAQYLRQVKAPDIIVICDLKLLLLGLRLDLRGYEPVPHWPHCSIKLKYFLSCPYFWAHYRFYFLGIGVHWSLNWKEGCCCCWWWSFLFKRGFYFRYPLTWLGSQQWQVQLKPVDHWSDATKGYQKILRDGNDTRANLWRHPRSVTSQRCSCLIQ